MARPSFTGPRLTRGMRRPARAAASPPGRDAADRSPLRGVVGGPPRGAVPWWPRSRSWRGAAAGCRRPRRLRGEIEPVDSRARGEGLGRGGRLARARSAGWGAWRSWPRAAGADARGRRSTRRPTPCSRRSSPHGREAAGGAQRALPGPQTTGIGLVPGPGTGGGGGSGGGSGGGVGRGIGPGTEFFGAREHGRSFAYVIDCSGSMATRNSLDVAKRELLASLNQLPPDAQFARHLLQPAGPRLHRPRRPAGPDAGHRGQQGEGPGPAPDGRPRRRHRPHAGPPHGAGAQARGRLLPDRRRPDDQQRRQRDPRRVRRQPDPGRRVRPRPRPRPDTPLRRLATTTGGTYRYIDVTRFPRSTTGF